MTPEERAADAIYLADINAPDEPPSIMFSTSAGHSIELANDPDCGTSDENLAFARHMLAIVIRQALENWTPPGVT